jgi:hypothetical protein
MHATSRLEEISVWRSIIALKIASVASQQSLPAKNLDIADPKYDFTLTAVSIAAAEVRTDRKARID